MISKPVRGVRRLAAELGRRWRSVPSLLLVACLALQLATVGLAGCGTRLGLRSDYGFPNALVNLAGEEIHIATLVDIVNDDELDEAQKREALEELGIEDEDLQDYVFDRFVISTGGGGGAVPI